MYDILIVGAGPAGSTAALYAHKYNLKTLLIDKANFPRDKVCGDALSGKTVRMLKELDLLEQVENLDGAIINRITFGSPNNKIFDVYLRGTKNNQQIKKGFVIPRKVFDNFLFNKADEVTDTKQGFTVQDLIFENGYVVGVKGLNDNGIEEEIRASLVLGCDGPASILSRKLEMYKMEMDHTSIAIRCYFEGVKGLTDQIELHYVKELNPGYFWLFPAGNGKANIGLGLSKNNAKNQKRTLRQIMDELIKNEYFSDRFINARALEKPVGWNLPLGSIHRKNHGNGFMLLGDAAGLVDPFTGEGIGNAMVSAKYAIEVAARCIKNGDYSESELSNYDKLIWDELGGELRTSTKLQSLARSKFLLNFVINRGERNESVREIISGMLANEIPKDDLSNPMFYFKILFS
tara:strand:- start:14993 stop:16207 length:1215 start_codon:yes stop_codon:yes gene_type:complete